MSNRTEVAKRKPSQAPPGDYRHCASSRLYGNGAKRNVSSLFRAALRVRFCITHARCNEVIVASASTSGQACHILGDGNRQKKQRNQVRKGNTKSVATKIVELLITEQVSRTAEALTRTLSVNYR
jgi:hypothetical protein